MHLLAAKEKLKAVLEVIDQGKTIGEVSRKYGYTRQALWLWIRKYRQRNTSDASRVLEPDFRKGKAHPRSVTWGIERQILDLVLRNPSASIYSINKELQTHGCRISVAGVYQVLLRHGLQTKELRRRYSAFHPSKIASSQKLPIHMRAKLMEDYLRGGKKIAEVCRIWQVSRPTFYSWLKRYQEQGGVISALSRGYKRGVEHHRSTISPQTREKILGVVRANPSLSCHKLYSKLPKLASLPAVTHQALQNFLSRESLNTYNSRLAFAKRFVQESLPVAPIYVPEMPLYKLRMILSPFVTVPKLMVTKPAQGISLLAAVFLPLFVFYLFVRSIFVSAHQVSMVGLIFASIALLFGFVFFIYSMSYYTSIFMVLKLAQSGTGQTGISEVKEVAGV